MLRITGPVKSLLAMIINGEGALSLSEIVESPGGSAGCQD